MNYTKLQQYRTEKFLKSLNSGNEEFYVSINNEEYLFKVKADESGYGWWCIVPGMYEPGNAYGAHSMKSREDAALLLVEKIEEVQAENGKTMKIGDNFYDQIAKCEVII